MTRPEKLALAALAAGALAGSFWLGNLDRAPGGGLCRDIDSVSHPSEDSVTVRVPENCVQAAPLALCVSVRDMYGVPNAVVVQGTDQLAGCYL